MRSFLLLTRRRVARVVIAAVAASVAISGLQAAIASVGTGVGAAPITLKRAKQPGAKYRLPNLYVVNTGTERTSYTAAVQRLRPFTKNTRRVPRRWIRFSSRVFTLNPKQAVNIRLTLVLPRSARRGAYASNIIVSSAVRGRGFSRVGTSAATALRFKVAARRRR